MQIDALETLELESDLRRAVEQQQFFVEYQPIVELEREGVVGVEALIRWRHPGRGTVAPLDFIAASERTGLIVPISRWVLLEACRQAESWHLLPADMLKIDKSFIDGIVEKRDVAALTEGIVRLARTLQLRVLAEGIETPEQAERLRGMACEFGQGFHFLEAGQRAGDRPATRQASRARRGRPRVTRRRLSTHPGFADDMARQSAGLQRKP